MKSVFSSLILVVFCSSSAHGIVCGDFLSEVNISNEPIFSDSFLADAAKGDVKAIQLILRTGDTSPKYEMAFIPGVYGKLDFSDVINILLVENISKKNHSAVEALLKSELVELNDNRLSTLPPLLEAIRVGDAKMIALLRQDSRLDPNQVDALGRPAIVYAVEKGDVEVVKELLRHAYLDLKQVSIKVPNPLSVAIQRNRQEIFDLLMEDSRVDLNGLVGSVTSPMIEALKSSVAHYKTELSKTNRVDISIKIKSGKTALDFM